MNNNQDADEIFLAEDSEEEKDVKVTEITDKEAEEIVRVIDDETERPALGGRRMSLR